MIKLLWSGMLVLLLLSGCGWNGTPTRNNDFVPLTSIQIIPVSPSIAVSGTIAAKTSTRLSVIGNFSGLFTRDITGQAVWSSDTPTVAGFITAGSPERVTGNIPGTAVLTATVKGVSATYTLTVSPATIIALTITPAAPTTAKGLTIQFAASGTFSDATTQDLTFDASWGSSDTAVATISDSAGTKGLAQALTLGPTTITATFEGISGTTVLTVADPVLQSITVSPANPTSLSLSSRIFTATGAYSDGTTRDISSQVAWASSSPSRATINGNGTASTLSEGPTTISATLNNANGIPVSGSTSLKVTGGTLTGITLSTPAITPVNNSITMVRNSAARITATGTFSNGSTRDITGAVAWAVTSASLGSVTPQGGNLAWLNSGAVTGSTTVTATSGTLVASTGLTVSAPTLNSITISPTSLTDLTAGTSSRFTLTATFSGNTTQDVTVGASWSSLAGAIAAVGDSGILKGRVSGVAGGSTTISAGYAGLSITAPVTVRTRTIQSLTISGTTSIISGNQVKLTATAVFSDGFNKDVTEETVWTIDKPTVALFADSLNQPGQVVAVDSGSAILTASFLGKTATANITVP